MPKTKRFVDCPEHGTQEGHGGFANGQPIPEARAIVEAASEHKGKWVFLAKLPHKMLHCPDCYAVLPYREMKLQEGRKTEKCGPLCWNAKRDLCNCVCEALCHSKGKCLCKKGV